MRSDTGDVRPRGQGVVVIGVDQGKSGTRALLWSNGEERAEHDGPGCRFTAGRPPSDGILPGLLAAVAGLHLESPPDVVAVGTTGCPSGDRERAEIAHEILRATAAEQVVLTEDVVTAHLGALSGRPGVVISAGTGAVAMWTDGVTTRRSDGWGPLLGDEGSGYDIGRSGLAAAFAAADGRGADTLLRQMASEHLGGLDLAAVQAVQAHPDPVLLIASFVPRVVEADQSGDASAHAILDRAGRLLARTAAAAARSGPTSGPEVAASGNGRLFGSQTLRQAFELQCPQHRLCPVPASGDGRSGAVLLGCGLHPRAFEGMLTQAGAAPSHASGSPADRPRHNLPRP